MISAALAQATGWPEWLSVPLAFYTGMRREEIAKLEWSHIRLDEGTILVIHTKTKTSRTIPLNNTMETYLAATPNDQRKGYVVPGKEGFDRLWRLNTLARKIQKAKKVALVKEMALDKPPPSRAKDYHKKKAAYKVRYETRKKEIATILKRIGWNSFRHTFGSLLAQSGVSIDKISSWMGNTPEVCRRHYAQFIPRGRRDNEIDKL